MMRKAASCPAEAQRSQQQRRRQPRRSFVQPSIFARAQQHHLRRRLGFRVQGLRLRIRRAAGFRIQGSGLGIQGSGFEVQDSGFRVLSLRVCVLGLSWSVFKSLDFKTLNLKGPLASDPASLFIPHSFLSRVLRGRNQTEAPSVLPLATI